MLLLLSGTQFYPQAAKRTTVHREQTEFGAEGDFEHPVVISGAALQSLRASTDSDDSIQMCAQDERIQVNTIPASWFVASEIRLSRAPSSGLVIRGEHLCLRGAHIAQFWVLTNSTAGYRIVFSGRADALRVLPTRTNGYRDLQLIIVTQAGDYVDYVNFRYRNGRYHKAGDRLEHPN